MFNFLRYLLVLLFIPFCAVFAQTSSKHVILSSINKLSKTDSIEVVGAFNGALKLAAELDSKTVQAFSNISKLVHGKTDDYSKKIRFEALTQTASYFWKTGNYNEAKVLYKDAMLEAELQQDDKKKAIVMLGQAVVADYQSDFETSIKYNLAALAFFEKINEVKGIYIVSGNIGNTYIRLRQFNKAVEVLDRGILLSGKSNDMLVQANLISSLARAYKGLGNKQKELELKQRSFAIFKKANSHQGIATVGINLGVFYSDKYQIDSAKKYYYTALKSSRKINNKGNIALLFNNMAAMYIKIDNLDSAIYFTDSAFVYAKRNGDKLAQADAFANRADIYRIQRKHDLAEDAFDNYVKVKDSIYDTKMQNKVSEMEVRYETAKKEDRIILLSRDNSIKHLELQRSALEIERSQALIDKQKQTLLINELRLSNNAQQLKNQQLDAKQKAQSIKTLQKQTQIQNLEITNKELALKQRNYTISAILLGFVVIGGFSFSYYNRQKLKQENRVQAEIHKQQEIATKAVFDGEQQERIRIARDLHDSIGQMLSVVKMNLSATNDNDNPTLQLVDKTIAEVRNISHNLIPEELNFGLFNALEDICDKINAAGNTIVVCEITDEVKGLKFTKQNELSIYRIVQEVLGNMIKHAQASEINLDIDRAINNIIISIKDNGKGFDTSKVKDSKGLGWKNITARVHLLDGKMDVQSERLSGTKIEISIPE